MIMTMCVGSICLQIDLMSDDKEDHLGWAEMGQVKINWAVVLGPNREIRLDYGRPTPMNWSSAATIPQPIKELLLNVNLGKNEGHFVAVLRDQ